MKKIVPFKKDMLFNNNVSEITSISLEHDLKVQDSNIIGGNFIINGEYKMSDSSFNTELFNFELPCTINLDERYILDDVLIDIDDFFYEIVNANILEVNIDVSLDKLGEKEFITNKIEMPFVESSELEDAREEKNMKTQEKEILECVKEDRCVEEENIDQVTSVFDSFNDELETYRAYKVYIVREGDTLDTIIQRYGVSKESLEEYNDLTEINLGDKIIIADLKDEKN